MPKPRFVPHWKAVIHFLRDPKTDWKPKIALVLAVGYLITPIDFFPDVIPVLGWLDDIGVLSMAAMWILKKASEQVAAGPDPDDTPRLQR